MTQERVKWLYTKPLTDKGLEDIADKILLDDTPLDNNVLTDVEGDDEDDDNNNSSFNDLGSTSNQLPTTNQNQMESTNILASSEKENVRTEIVKEKQQNVKPKRKPYTKEKSKTNANLQKENLLGDRHWNKEDIDENMPEY
ncbi:hypothetical protein MML48_6g00000456 [Holotrichia oblita]|uniref:Uncharacterized protein n=1 Tax=Holotrichia oblita TaxID=644536 RepID=A0ACB9SWS6_HOLOL|nr:hypothetical protein MML48_6g00000456 [Holotrichia oblita]